MSGDWPDKGRSKVMIGDVIKGNELHTVAFQCQRSKVIIGDVIKGNELYTVTFQCLLLLHDLFKFLKNFFLIQTQEKLNVGCQNKIKYSISKEKKTFLLSVTSNQHW